MSGIPRECKRLAEVDFPISAVSIHAAREKSVRQGHPSTLHLWWARRPLASSRAMLLSLLLPDPCDPACPGEFRSKSRALLSKSLEEIGPTDKELRASLLRFIAVFADWDKSADSSYLAVARGLVRAAYGDDTPLVVDPFAGGGSIPLEALRLGCGTFASDLNPVACLILKVLLEDLATEDASKPAGELREIGARMKIAAERELASVYPPDPDGARPIAYLWARTIRCESPNCGCEIPLLRSLWLCKKANRLRALRPIVDRTGPRPPRINFEISQPSKASESISGTVTRAKATCLACGTTLSPDRVRSQLRELHGGADPVFDEKGRRSGGARLLAVVITKQEATGRLYRLPTERDYEAVFRARTGLETSLKSTHSVGISAIPDEPLPPQGTLGFRVQLYGMTQWSDLFTSRQKLALSTLARLAIQLVPDVERRRPLALAVSRCTDYWSSGVVWANEGEFVAHTFGRQALPLVWDFAEAVPWTDSSGNFDGAIEWVASVASSLVDAHLHPGQAQLADAGEYPLPDTTADVWFTDPPYYDAIPYADLSDFFFVWLKRVLPGWSLMSDPFDAKNPLTPKSREIVQDEVKLLNGHPKDRKFFENRMAKAFGEGRRVLRDDGIGCVVFAHKTTEGWEALLSGMIKEGWVITSSWPIATERPGRLRSQDSAALATSVHLVCRPRDAAAPVGDWAEVARELPGRVRTWMDRLVAEGVRGADLVFACIGPAMEIYSRYSRVVDAQDREIPLGGDPTTSDPCTQGYLAKVWEVVGRIALEQVLGDSRGGATAFEEDARLTALFLWAIQGSADESSEPSTVNAEDPLPAEPVTGSAPRGYSLVYDVVRRFAQPLGIHLESWEGRIIETEGGMVRLLTLSERIPQLFDEGDVQKLTSEPDETSRSRQMTLFPDQELSPPEKGSPTPKGRKEARAGVVQADSEPRRKTTLDRLHTAMLLQSHGASVPLRTLMKDEKKHGPEFERLARSMTVLYPQGSEERRLLEALSLAIPK